MVQTELLPMDCHLQVVLQLRTKDLAPQAVEREVGPGLIVGPPGTVLVVLAPAVRNMYRTSRFKYAMHCDLLGMVPGIPCAKNLLRRSQKCAVEIC